MFLSPPKARTEENKGKEEGVGTGESGSVGVGETDEMGGGREELL